MGNCASIQVELGIVPRIRVVHAVELRVVDVELPTSQASMSMGELMLKFLPSHFVAHLENFSANVHLGIVITCIGKHASPLGTDAEATPGLVCILFPMPKSCSPLQSIFMFMILSSTAKYPTRPSLHEYYTTSLLAAQGWNRSSIMRIAWMTIFLFLALLSVIMIRLLATLSWPLAPNPDHRLRIAAEPAHLSGRERGRRKIDVRVELEQR